MNMYQKLENAANQWPENLFLVREGTTYSQFIAQVRARAATLRDAGVKSGDRKNCLDKYKLVIVCGSTASVPATADLMMEIAKCNNGKIILSGRISGVYDDFLLDTNPYNAEYKFLQKLGLSIDDVQTIDVGDSSCMDVMNIAFGNSGKRIENKLDNCTLIECDCESEEARTVAYIAKCAVSENKSVLVITPDAAANQRIKSEMMKLNINVDFSSGVSGNMTNVGRAILNLFDFWIENNQSEYEKLYAESGYNIFDMLVNFVDNSDKSVFAPAFDIDKEEDIPIWMAIKNMSSVLCANNIVLNIHDARAFIADAIGSVSIRLKVRWMQKNYRTKWCWPELRC